MEDSSQIIDVSTDPRVKCLQFWYLSTHKEVFWSKMISTLNKCSLKKQIHLIQLLRCLSNDTTKGFGGGIEIDVSGFNTANLNLSKHTKCHLSVMHSFLKISGAIDTEDIKLTFNIFFDIPILNKPYNYEIMLDWFYLLVSFRGGIYNFFNKALFSMDYDQLIAVELSKILLQLRKRPSDEFSSDDREKIMSVFSYLKKTSPEKYLRELMTSFYALDVPISEADISYESIDESELVTSEKGWSLLIYSLLAEELQCNSSIRLGRGVDKQKETALKAIIVDLTNISVNRLKLRKKQKVRNEKGYTLEQASEQSSFWRDTYIKLLGELKWDDNKDVHRTLHFVSHYDPEKAIRASAKKAYNKVLYTEVPEQNRLLYLERSLKACFWWLCVVNRKTLKGDIDEVAARLSRRRLLR